jgi:hypothetical protein
VNIFIGRQINAIYARGQVERPHGRQGRLIWINSNRSIGTSKILIATY